MIFYYNSNGDLLYSVYEEVYQGSHRANKIYFVCPTFSKNIVSVAFTLPDGTATERHVMKSVSPNGIQGVYDDNDINFCVWRYYLPSAITQKRGTVTAQFYISTPQNETVATASVGFSVLNGVEGSDAQIGDSYTELAEHISEYAVRLDDLEEEVPLKLNKRSAAQGLTKVYAYEGGTQTSVSVVKGLQNIASGAIPLYNADLNLATGSPVSGTDCVNKDYADANLGTSLSVSVNPETFVMTVSLLNSQGEVLSSGTVDFPLESVVVGGEYNEEDKKLVLSLQGGGRVDVPVSALVSGLLQKRTGEENATGVYAFTGQTQTAKTLSAAPVAGAVAQYGQRGELQTAAPVNGNDAINKTYADENFKITAIKDPSATSLSLTPAPNTEYFYGELTDFTLAFSTENACAGDTFYITFKSGNTPTALSVNSLNAVFNVQPVSESDVIMEISGVFNGEKWLVAWRQI